MKIYISWLRGYKSCLTGKDGIPYPVDHKTYDQSIELLTKAISKTKLGIREKNEALNRLNRVRMR